MKEPVFREIDSVVILDDASGMYVGQREGLRQILHTFGLLHHLVVGFAVKLRDLSVRLDGARPNVDYRLSSLLERNRDIRLFPPVLREDLYAHVVVFIRSAAVV